VPTTLEHSEQAYQVNKPSLLSSPFPANPLHNTTTQISISLRQSGSGLCTNITHVLMLNSSDQDVNYRTRHRSSPFLCELESTSSLTRESKVSNPVEEIDGQIKIFLAMNFKTGHYYHIVRPLGFESLSYLLSSCVGMRPR
jgi:hypothetical protein